MSSVHLYHLSLKAPDLKKDWQQSALPPQRITLLFFPLFLSIITVIIFFLWHGLAAMLPPVARRTCLNQRQCGSNN